MISLSSSSGGGWRFRPRLWPTLATLAALAVLLTLGTWQVQRLEWKEALIAEREAGLSLPPAPLPTDAEDWRQWEFRRVSLEGVFRHDLEQRFGLSAHRGRPGHHLLTPLVRPDGAAVLVDRGWIPTDRKHPVSRLEARPEGTVEISGIARYRGGETPSWLRPDNEPERGVWYWYDLPALEQTTGLELLPLVVEAAPGPAPDELPIAMPTQALLPNNHLQYAVTWYGLALTLVGVYVAFSFERRERRA